MAFAVRMRLTGFEKAVSRLRGAEKNIRTRSLKRAVKVAAVPGVEQAKREAPKDTGVMRRSMRAKVMSYRRGRYVVAIVGPRSYKYANGRNPQKYAHLVELGHRTVRGGKLTRGSKAGTGRVVGHVKANPFMRRSVRTSFPLAIKRFTLSLRLNVFKDFTSG